MQDEKNTVKGTPEENQISNCIPPCNATNHLFNLVYVLLTKDNRFCYVFSNPGESIASVWDKGKLQSLVSHGKGLAIDNGIPQ